MQEYYHLTVAGCERDLAICPVNEKMDIAAFIMFGDIELTEKAATALLKVCPEHDIIVTAEAKGIPLAYEMARQGCRQYFVARKRFKLYMRNPLKVSVHSITTQGEQHLYLSEEEVSQIKGKRVLIADDVISTGESLQAVEKLIEAAGGEVVGKAAVLAEGDAAQREDIIYLETLPLFFK